MVHVILLASCAFLLTSCGGGFTDSGFGLFPEVCYSWDGTWTGPSTSDEGKGTGTIVLNIEQKGDSCKVSGTVSFPPCVPATPISGSVNTLHLEIVTTDGALHVSAPDIRIPTFDPSTLSKEAGVLDQPIGENWSASYIFFNKNNVPNCPESDLGTAKLTKTG